MIYLIGQLGGWLLLTAAFAALAGWAFAAQQAVPAEAAMRRDRAKLLRDLASLATGDRTLERDDSDALAARRLADLNSGRAAELERALEVARARADDSSSRVAELERELDRRSTELDEIRRTAAERAREIDVEPEPSQDDAALQAWRLRYFEQRVRYLESAPRALPAPAPPPEASEAYQSLEWRMREAEARADYLANEVRALSAAPALEEPESPFASNADVDALLRWRLLYLERRVAYLQDQRDVAQTVMQVSPPVQEVTADPDRWKWRARYLEARVRHLETRPPVVVGREAPVQAATTPIEAPRSDPRPERPAPSTAPRRKPAVMPAPHNGAPDDFTLIDGVSLQQQSTLYSLGVFHFEQVAAWTDENIAWVDQYLRLRGRIEQEEWVEQAADLARDGPQAARRIVDSEDA
jgi:predicted flap endonuclease-1-like 5' DNA nuclease